MWEGPGRSMQIECDLQNPGIMADTGGVPSQMERAGSIESLENGVLDAAQEVTESRPRQSRMRPAAQRVGGGGPGFHHCPTAHRPLPPSFSHACIPGSWVFWSHQAAP